MKPNIGNRGSSLISVIALMALLAAMSLGFLYMASFQIRAAQENLDRLECIAAGKRFHRDLCSRIGTGMAGGNDWKGVKIIEEAAQRDYEEAQQSYESSLEEWKRSRGAEEERPLWEEYETDLKNRVYRISGRTRKEEGGPEIQTELKIWYFSGRASAETRFFWKGEEIRLTAEIYAEEPYEEKERERAEDSPGWKVRYYEKE